MLEKERARTHTHTHTCVCVRERERERDEEVLFRVKEQWNILHELSKGKANWIAHILRRNCLLQQVIEGKIKGGRSDRKTREKT